MVVSCFIVFYHTFLNAFPRHIQRYMYLPVLSARRRHNSQLHSIEGVPGIPSCQIRQKIHGILFYHGIISAHSFLLIIHSPADEFLYILPGQGLQFKNNRTGYQRAVYLKIGIFRGCADKDDSAVLHERQKIILLAFIEPVNLINKQNRFFPIHPLGVFGLRHHFLHVLFPGNCGIDLGKLRARRIGNNLCQCRFPRSRRPVKNDGADLIRLDRPVKQLVLADNMLLPHHLVQSRGTKPGRQRGFLFHVVFSHIIK